MDNIINNANISIFSDHLQKERYDHNLYVDGAGKIHEIKMGSLQEKILLVAQKTGMFSLRELSEVEFSELFDAYEGRISKEPSQSSIINIQDFFR